MPEAKGDWLPITFIGEEIEVGFARPPLLSKKPPPPSRFSWQEQSFEVAQLISSWSAYERRGRMARNMSAEHLRIASTRGSWGVGRLYYRLQTKDGRVFDLYYDRAPARAGDRHGHWILWRELRRA